MIHIRDVSREEFVKGIMRKMAPPLGEQSILFPRTAPELNLAPITVTLVSSAPEVQWVALRNINLILQKRPDALSHEMRVFFCKYNDPPYVKVEKLEIMIKLATEKNVDTFLSELKECVGSLPQSSSIANHQRFIGTLPRWTLTLCASRCGRLDSVRSRSRERLSAASTFCSTSSRLGSAMWCRSRSSSSR